MSEAKTLMEIFKLLKKTNCRECDAPTCLAFVAAVFQGKKQIDECPYLGDDVIEKYKGIVVSQNPAEESFEKNVKQLKEEIMSMDLSLQADKLGGKFLNDRLTIKIFGKDFSIDSKGNFSTDIHINPWIVGPVLNYITEGSGLNIKGNWVPFRELRNGMDWNSFFVQRCKKPIKRVAATYTDLFEDLILLLNGKQVENHYKSDISLILYPLPKFPLLICYWKPEEGMDSSLNIFFDSTAEDNLNIELIYTLGAGLAIMFEKISLRHVF